jgi:3-oxoacyl-[acyl-carrier protein] reductase
MPGTLDGQVALVTGGSRGIGLAAARGLGLAGATVIVVGQDGERAGRAVASLREAGITAEGRACDVADAASVNSMRAELGLLADVDILVASAGVMSQRMSKTLRTDAHEWRRVMSVNLDGVFNVVSAFGPGMVERRRGRIIAVSACLGRFSGPGTSGGLAPYRVSKAAVNALVRNLAAETGHGSRGVLVDAMCPNHCRTDMGGPDAPRSAEEGAETIMWLATRDVASPGGDPVPTGLLWEDRQVVPW